MDTKKIKKENINKLTNYLVNKEAEFITHKVGSNQTKATASLPNIGSQP